MYMCSEEKYDIHIRNDACFLWTSQKWNKMCLWVNKAASIYLNDDNQLKQRCCTLTCNYLIALYSSLYHWTIINFCLACEKRHRMKLCQLKYDQRVAKWHIFFFTFSNLSRFVWLNGRTLSCKTDKQISIIHLFFLKIH